MKLISYRDPVDSTLVRTGLVLPGEMHFVDLLVGYEQLDSELPAPELAQMQTLIEAGEPALAKIKKNPAMGQTKPRATKCACRCRTVLTAACSSEIQGL